MLSPIPDLINGSFELVGAFFISLSIRRVLIDKRVAGVSWIHVAFWSVWGFWNLYYYPHLGQWVSFVGGIGVTTANTIYVGLLLYYGGRWRNRCS